jgi:hypothetical protein
LAFVNISFSPSILTLWEGKSQKKHEILEPIDTFAEKKTNNR